MKKIALSFCIFFASHAGLYAQTAGKVYDQAENLMAGEQFAAALPLYLQLLKNDSLDANLNFKIGICYLNSRSQKAKAVYFLNKAIEPTASYYKNAGKVHNNSGVPTNILGPSHLSYDFEKVNECSEKLKKLIVDVKDKELSVIEVLNLKMEIQKIGDELQEFNDSPINFKIETSNKSKNSSYVGYSSVLSEDKTSLIFNFDKPGNKWEENNKEDNFFEEAVHPSMKKLTDTLAADANAFIVSTDTAETENEATVAISDDNQVILTYKRTNGEANLYVSILSGNHWSAPEKMIKSINTKGWEPNECVSADGNWLYFTSNRKGGFGGEDIYVCKKLPNGEWSKAMNLGPTINTEFDDLAPYVLPGGKTLYFSSNGRNPQKTFDIFSTSLILPNGWTEPVKVGYPSLPPLEDKNQMQPATVENKADNSYIFTFKTKTETPLRIIKGYVTDTADRGMRWAKIKVVDNETGLATSFSNPGNQGPYSFILPDGKNKNVTYIAEGCVFQSENICISSDKSCYEKRNAIKLYPVTAGSKTILKNIFFDSTHSSLSGTSNTELENIVQLLKEYPEIIVEINGYMLSKENAKNNKVIAQQRAQAVQEYLRKNGIPIERVTARGYVKYKPKSSTKKKTKEQEVASEWIELNIIDKKNS